MHWWQALILGIVEGITEYLPVSSTGHLILTSWLLGLTGPGVDEAQRKAVESFEIVIQAGAIAAVLGLYRQRVAQMCRGFLGKDPAGLKLAGLLILAFIPAAVLGKLFHTPIKDYLFHPWPVVGALFAGAWLMLLTAKNEKSSNTAQGRLTIDQVDWRMALLIGVGQCVAMWPGTSRSMMTIVAALLLKMRRNAAAEFSFLLGLVTLGAATCYEGSKEYKVILHEIGWGPLLVGFLAATVSAAVAVKWFVGFLNHRGLAPFGWYRLALAAVVAAAFWFGWIEGL